MIRGKRKYIYSIIFSTLGLLYMVFLKIMGKTVENWYEFFTLALIIGGYPAVNLISKIKFGKTEDKANDNASDRFNMQ